MNKTGIPKAAFGKLLLNEVRLALRTPLGLLAGLGLPILLLVIFGSIPAFSTSSKDLGGLSYFSLSFPILICFSILAIGFNILPVRLATYRQQGILRRLSITPIPPAWLLAAQVIINVCIIIIGIIMLTVVGMMAFHLGAPKDIGYFLLFVTITITAFFSIGLCIASMVKSANSANIISGLLFYPMLLFSGIWIPREIMPPALRLMSDWSPMGAAVGGIQNAMQGSSFSFQYLLILVGYTVIFGYLAVRLFKWE